MEYILHQNASYNGNLLHENDDDVCFYDGHCSRFNVAQNPGSCHSLKTIIANVWISGGHESAIYILKAFFNDAHM